MTSSTPPRWPDLSAPAYAEAAERVLASGVLAEGPEVAALEREFAARFAPGNEVFAVGTGTDAIEIALRALGLRAGQPVLVPALSFSGSVTPVVRCGGIPVFCDVDPLTLNVSAETVERAMMGIGRSLSYYPPMAVLVHLHGRPVPGDVFRFLRERGVRVVEDCAQALGTVIDDGAYAGLAGDAAAWSLNRRKTVVAGEGGMVRVPDGGAARALRRYGERDRDVSEVPYGFNGKLPELSAAIARVSLGHFERNLTRARHAAPPLYRALVDAGLALEHAPLRGREVHSYHKLRLEAVGDRDATVKLLRDHLGVPASVWQTAALPDHPAFQQPYGRARFASILADELFCIGHDDFPPAAFLPDDVEAWTAAINHSKETPA